jgi:hypothetical protein
MSIVTKDSYKADVFNFDVEQSGEIINLTINNVISWEWMKMKLTKEETKGLADFLYSSLQMNVARQVMVEDIEALRNLGDN